MVQPMLRVPITLKVSICLLALTGCGKDEPVEPKSYPVLDAPMPPPPAGAETSVSIMVEMIEADGGMFSDWQLDSTLEPTRATPLRRVVQEWLHEGSAALLETMVVHGKSGNRAESKSVREIVYPSEYLYPIKRTTVTTTDPKKKPTDIDRTVTETTGERIRGVAPTGHVFATREAGTVLQVDSTVDPIARTVQIDLATELVHYFENLDWQATGHGETGQFTAPVFDTNSFRTSLTLQSGVYGIIGSGTLPPDIQSQNFSNPILLVFIRADLNQVNP